MKLSPNFERSHPLLNVGVNHFLFLMHDRATIGSRTQLSLWKHLLKAVLSLYCPGAATACRLFRGCHYAPDTAFNRLGSPRSPLAAVRAVCQSTMVFCSEPSFEAASPVFLVLRKNLRLRDAGAWSLCCLFSLRYAADTVQGQSPAFVI